ncbi:MarR family transcriptional regulator [Corynebacterium suranareeae]|uniref:MarR family transcriptional regulator n=1 Tax=Corynebacterium suranareeae TaxID=2506452 RepID=A0A169RUZ9_9CORY|nr:MarR family winged helix-turn-helix transcriptional regulator [Corynebacterium suranareeae]BAU95558.1 MarR family transcriptional regulator [Corynebacterium suranareeae]
MTTPRWLSTEEQQLWRMILSAVRKMERTLDETLVDDHNLTTSEYAVLVVLSEAGDQEMRLRDMCQELDWDRSRTSHQITRMDKKGLVSKVKCAGDARGVIVEITPEGERRLKDAVPAHVETVRSLIFDPMEEGHMEGLRSYLTAVLNSDNCVALNKQREEQL